MIFLLNVSLAGDSCISQLLSISHGIYKAFAGNSSLEVRGVFLGLSKAFFFSFFNSINRAYKIHYKI